MTEPKPVRLQRSRKKGARLVSPNGLPIVCVDRSTRWGNPFDWRDIMTLFSCTNEEAREMASDWFSYGLRGFFQPRPGRVRDRIDYIREHVHELRNTNLACWCKLPAPGEPDLCHASILLEIANA